MITHHESLVGAARIHWVSDGDEHTAQPPFLLIHGWGSSVVKWLDVMPLLAAERRAIAIDLPGFGRSSTPPGSYSPAWLAGSIRAFMDEQHIDRAIIVGNSLGGLIAMHAAAAWPERFEAYVGVAPALPNDGPQPPLRNLAAMMAPTIPFLGERLFARYIRRPADAIVDESLERNFVRPERAPSSMREALLEDARARSVRTDQVLSVTRSNRAMMWALSGARETTWRTARAVRIPTLFLWGAGDALVPAHIGERAVREVPGAHLVMLEDCGHNPQMECPEDFAAATIAFARAVAATPRA